MSKDIDVFLCYLGMISTVYYTIISELNEKYEQLSQIF